MKKHLHTSFTKHLINDLYIDLSHDCLVEKPTVRNRTDSIEHDPFSV